jgi:hypothetical protein
MARNQDNESLVCPICYDNITHGFYLTACDHVFHLHCVRLWLELSKTCPACRKALLFYPSDAPDVWDKHNEVQ